MATRVTDGVSRLCRSRPRACIALTKSEEKRETARSLRSQGQSSFASLQKSRRDHRSYVRTEPLSGIVSVRAQSYICGIMRT